MTLRVRILVAACGLSSALTACDQIPGDASLTEMRWARAALDRNHELTVLAEDDQAKVFTVRMSGSGETRVVELAALAAGPAEATVGASDSFKTESQGESRKGEGEDQPRQDVAAQEAVAQAPPAEAAAPPAQTPSPTTSPTTSAPAAALSPGRRLIASGPGYSIAAADSRASSGSRSASASASASAAGAQSQSRSIASKRSEPMICQGDRRLRIDGQNLEFPADAIIAESGCDLHITNSRIVAKGIAVNAHAANVHIENSLIEGGTDSIDGSQGAQLYIQSSTFKGLSRRLDSSALHDLGGNVWN